MYSLPQVLQVLIGEFNADHRPKMVLVFNELLEKHNGRIIRDSSCRNCWNDADPYLTCYILFHKYTFCSDWCQYDLEHSIRKSWTRRKNY